jgi:hypothetical protein
MTAVVLVAAVVVSDPTPVCLSFPSMWLLIQTPPSKLRNVLGRVVSRNVFGQVHSERSIRQRSIRPLSLGVNAQY